MKDTEVYFLKIDLSRDEKGKNVEAEKRENVEVEVTGVNGSVVTERRSLGGVWRNVRKMKSREKQYEILG